ncbi:MAG: sensor domain-containing diguanylate cyclase [Sulfurovum sp.]|nr:sensor domain-containing diguanylate cyclase [Sulfurovum sp.]
MSEYEAIIGTKVANYIDAFKDTYQENDCDIYFIGNGESSVYLDLSCKLFLRFQKIDQKGILIEAKGLAQSCSKHNMPYIILHNIIERFKNTILCDLLQEDHPSSLAYHFLKQLNIASDTASKYYLSQKIKKFIDTNQRRIKTIDELIDSESIYFFEGHLLWLDKLAHAILDLNIDTLPELCPKACVLGKWLHADGKEIIVEEQRWQHLDMLHRHLHLIAKRVQISMRSTPIDYHYLLLLLSKADLVSLSIGIDLTLISNIEYIKCSSKDPLTGVLNRQLLDKIFKTQFELSKTLDTGFALIMADIDNFKQVNDYYGHIFGDIVLKEFANVMIDSTRKSDFIIRFGGEEFIIILPVTTLHESKEIAEKICSKFAMKSIDKDNESLRFTASFGVSYIHPEANESSSTLHMSELIDVVDQKLLLAKQLGKNRVVG